MEDLKHRYCTLCRNHCTLDNPKCPEVLTDAMLAQKAAAATAAAECCTLCGNRCPYDALQCDTGRTMAELRGKLPRQQGD